MDGKQENKWARERHSRLNFLWAWPHRKKRLDMKAVRLVGLFIAIASASLLAQSTSVSQMMQGRHWNGQSVAPVYEGFDINADGSHNMWFGYMNRNEEESIDIPVGAANAFEPGGDRGQPTHFVPRRHKDVFKVTVPKEFADKTLTWKLNAHGQAQQVVATLKPVWQIDRLRTTRGGNSEKVSSNLPPIVSVSTTNQTADRSEEHTSELQSPYDLVC